MHGTALVLVTGNAKSLISAIYDDDYVGIPFFVLYDHTNVVMEVWVIKATKKFRHWSGNRAK
jgi:hypothetical protein